MSSHDAREIWIASNNKGKMAEFNSLLHPLTSAGYRLRSQDELRVFTPPKETGTTFEENARLKARALRAVNPGFWVLSDDSGLCVDGIDGLPGIHSARYAGERAMDAENTAKLLKMVSLRTPLNRSAKFVCVLIALGPKGEDWSFQGELAGAIAEKQSGGQGFGYDPVFIPTGESQTLASLGIAWKNQHSHRAVAIRQFLERMRAL